MSGAAFASLLACGCLLAGLAGAKQLQCAESVVVVGTDRFQEGVCATNSFCVNDTRTNKAGRRSVVRRCEQAGECKGRAACGAFVKPDKGLQSQVHGELCCCNDGDKCNNAAAGLWAPFAAIAVGLAAAAALRH